MEQYRYDEVNRLRTVNYGDGQSQSCLFDAVGKPYAQGEGQRRSAWTIDIQGNSSGQ